MSLYYVQKFLFELNRDPRLQAAYLSEGRASMAGYELDDEEIDALLEPDVGKLFHLGVNGQILMHFGAFHGIEWTDYLQRLSDGLERHGPVREGVYAVTGYEGVEAHSARIGRRQDTSGGTTTPPSLSSEPAKGA